MARMLAGLTAHRVVPLESGTDEAGGDLVANLVGVAQGGAQVTSALGAALSDGSVAPREAREVMGEIGQLERRLTGTKLRLASVARKAP
jgi:hypothetical protein